MRRVNKRSVLLLTLFICDIVEIKSQYYGGIRTKSPLSILNENVEFIDINREQGFLGIPGLEEPKNLKECKEALKIIARNYLEVGIHENELLQAVEPGKKIDEIITFSECQGTIISLVRYLYGIQRTMKFGNLGAIPCNIISWRDAKTVIKSFCLPHCSIDYKKEFLNAVFNNESLTTVNDFINAFYNASSICGYLERNEINFWLQKLPNLPSKDVVGSDENLILFLIKELMRTHLNVKAKVGKYNYWSLLESKQRKWSPAWIDCLPPLSRRTVWNIITRQRNNYEFLAFMQRLRSYKLGNVAPRDIVEKVLNKYNMESKDTLYHDDFPDLKTDDEWRALTEEMKLNREDFYFLKSLAQTFSEEEINSIVTQISEDEETYMHLNNIPLNKKGYEIVKELRAYLNDENIVVLYVIKLFSKKNEDLGEVVVEFLDQRSRDAAYDKIIQGGDFVMTPNGLPIKAQKLSTRSC